MEVKVEKAIKSLPTLQDKVQAIAINQYLIQKRALDKEIAAEISKIELKHRKTIEPCLEEVVPILFRSLILSQEKLTSLIPTWKESTTSSLIWRSRLRITTTPRSPSRTTGRKLSSAMRSPHNQFSPMMKKLLAI